MLDIDKELENILISNGIIKNITLNDAINAVKKFKDNLDGNDIVGIYAVGVDADTLLHFISSIEHDFRINYCFDKTIKEYKFRNIIKNTNVLSIDHIRQINVDYIILGSYQFRNELKDELRENGYNGIVVDFFQPMEEYLQEHTSDYHTIYEIKKSYKNLCGKEKESVLRRLIREYLLIRDFNSAFRYIDEYIMNEFDSTQIYENLKKGIEQLLSRIRNCINSRRNNDIIINWIDALPYMHLQDFPFLQSKAEHAVNFEHAYTVNPWTTETLKTMLYGEYSIENKLFLKDNCFTDETNLLKNLVSRGYKFSYLGMNKYVKLFDEQTILIPELNFRKDNSSIPRQWEALKLLCKEENPLCLLIHTLWETHEPYICGEIDPYLKFACTEEDWGQEACKIQAEVSGRYIDNQLEFYDGFLGRSAIKIYMSDHGRITNSIMRESRVHIIFIVDYAEIKNEKIEGIFSLIDFNKVIECCLDKEKDFHQLEREYALVEALDFYNPAMIKKILGNPQYNKAEALQRRGVITLRDRYCKFADDRECYFIAGDEKNDRINDMRYATRIEELRELSGNEFIDINQYEKFEYSKLLYLDLENINSDFTIGDVDIKGLLRIVKQRKD
ncbi:MAG: LTA synthase family protein [Lachnospiraceae bacterium]|nr:LTA synthase family protein [Lachnospiraceae bacterium]